MSSRLLIFILVTVCAASEVSAESEKILSVHLGNVEGFACRACPKGAGCVGPRHRKLCVIPKTVGKRCGKHPYSVCQRGLACVNHVCTSRRLKVGMSCTQESFCEPGALCVGPPQRKKCVTPISVGHSCEQNPYLVCGTGLECNQGICVRKISVGESCLTPGSTCTDGTLCAGIFNRKVCVIPKPLGHQCGQNPFSVCRKGLNCLHGRCSSMRGFGNPRAGGPSVGSAGKRCGRGRKCANRLKCQRGTCRIRRKHNCTANRSACVLGTVCAGPSHKPRCVRPMKAGKSCKRDLYRICAHGLTCQHGRCRAPAGSPCASTKMCMQGAVCAGRKRHKRCTAPRVDDNFSGGRSLRGIPVGGNCVSNGSVCVAGSVCAGSQSKKRCVVPIQPGHPCGQDPFWVCRNGSKCVRGQCTSPRSPTGLAVSDAGMRCGKGSACRKRLKCQRGLCRIPRKGNCAANRKACVLGTVCAGPPHKLRCVRPKTVGRRCRPDRYSVCARGLTCQNRRCRVPVGGSCKSNVVCTEGAVCVGSKRKKRCTIPHIVQNVPVAGVSGRIPVGGNCIAPGSTCVAGLVCAGTPYQKRCVIPMPFGYRCGQDAFWVCQPGMICVRGRCNSTGGSGGTGAGGAGMRCKYGRKCTKRLKCQGGICRIPRKGNCAANNNACVLGTLCAGPPNRLRCVRPMSEGEQCDQNSYWVCQRGLKCVHHICGKNW